MLGKLDAPAFCDWFLRHGCLLCLLRLLKMYRNANQSLVPFLCLSSGETAWCRPYESRSVIARRRWRTSTSRSSRSTLTDSGRWPRTYKRSVRVNPPFDQPVGQLISQSISRVSQPLGRSLSQSRRSESLAQPISQSIESANQISQYIHQSTDQICQSLSQAVVESNQPGNQ